MLHWFDAQSGKAIGEPYRHPVEVSRLQLTQAGPMNCRMLAFVDGNADLWVLSPAQIRLSAGGGGSKSQQSSSAIKLASMVDSFRWTPS